MADNMVVSMLSVSRPLKCDNDNTRLERSPAVHCRKKVVGKWSKRVISAVCKAYSNLSLTRNTTRLRVTCSITNPTVALNNNMAIGNNAWALPEGTTSLKICLVT